MRLADLLVADRIPTVVGFDDGPRSEASTVALCGVVCQGTRMEGMVWGACGRDGDDATDAVLDAIAGKFQPQLHAVLLDGLTFGGLNVVDLDRLAATLDLPCVAVLRRPPDREAFRGALEASGAGARWALVERAGPVHRRGDRVFQVRGCDPDTAARLLARVTDRGRVPEPLRLAHLIAGAVSVGTSGRRA